MNLNKILMLFFIVTTFLFAQKSENKIAGVWRLLSVQSPQGTQESGFLINFNSNGALETMGAKIAEWKFDTAQNSVIFSNAMAEKFNGSAKIVELTSNKLVLKKDNLIYNYEKVDFDKLTKTNENSGLLGKWKSVDAENNQRIFNFQSPNEITIVTIEHGSTESANGIWTYNPESKSVNISSFSPDYRGKYEVSFDGDNLILSAKQTKYVCKKVKKEDAEKLNFKYEDFGENDYPELPIWNELSERVEALTNISELEYDYAKLVKEAGNFSHEKIIKKIDVNEQEPSVKITKFYVFGDNREQASEKTKDNLTFNSFFPLDEPGPYKILGKEKISVPAGNFKCTVVEGFDGDAKIKYWMIDELPGIYAKIIRQEESPFGDGDDYSVQTLNKITKKN